MKTTATPQAAQMARSRSVDTSMLSVVSARSDGRAASNRSRSYDSQYPAWHKRYAVRSGIEGHRLRVRPLPRRASLPLPEPAQADLQDVLHGYLDQHDIQWLRPWRAVSWATAAKILNMVS